MLGGKSSQGQELEAASDSLSRPRRGRISVRFRRGPVIAILAGALAWGAIIAVWRLL